MQGRARGEWVAAAHASMLRAHDRSSRLAVELGAHAATDVTGFGLAGHLSTLLERDGLRARIDRGAVPFLPGARLLWQQGLRSTAHPANRDAFASRVAGATPLDEAWLFDPQTAGGLLLALDPARSEECRRTFREAGEPEPACIGCILDGDRTASAPGARIELVGAPESEAAPPPHPATLAPR
jgi:selenide,water dikinase